MIPWLLQSLDFDLLEFNNSIPESHSGFVFFVDFDSDATRQLYAIHLFITIILHAIAWILLLLYAWRLTFYCVIIIYTFTSCKSRNTFAMHIFLSFFHCSFVMYAIKSSVRILCFYSFIGDIRFIFGLFSLISHLNYKNRNNNKTHHAQLWYSRSHRCVCRAIADHHLQVPRMAIFFYNKLHRVKQFDLLFLMSNIHIICLIIKYVQSIFSIVVNTFWNHCCCFNSMRWRVVLIYVLLFVGSTIRSFARCMLTINVVNADLEFACASCVNCLQM